MEGKKLCVLCWETRIRNSGLGFDLSASCLYRRITVGPLYNYTTLPSYHCMIIIYNFWGTHPEGMMVMMMNSFIRKRRTEGCWCGKRGNRKGNISPLNHALQAADNVFTFCSFIPFASPSSVQLTTAILFVRLIYHSVSIKIGPF